MFPFGTFNQITYPTLADNPLIDELSEDVVVTPIPPEPTPDVFEDAPKDGAFYVRSNGNWNKISNSTYTVLEGYPTSDELEYEKVAQFSGLLYHKVLLEISGNATVGFWNTAAMQYDLECTTSGSFELPGGSMYEVHLKGLGALESLKATN